jgi:transposase
VIPVLDEVIITETPPPYACYGKRGQQVTAPITGNRAKRIIYGALNIATGAVPLLITDVRNQDAHRLFLTEIRRNRRGWNIILIEDRGSPHTADESRELSEELNIEIRWPPTACPELNPMNHLFRFVKGRALANRPTVSIDDSAQKACDSIYGMSPRERLTKTGILSGSFRLTK